MKNLCGVTIVFLLGLSALQMSLAGEPPCNQVLQIGAWNIQWLGNPEAGKRTAQKADDIAAYIRVAEVDVLALAEISVTGKDAEGNARNAQLDAAFVELNKSGAAWRYSLLTKRIGARAPQDQWTGIAWNERKVQKVGGPLRLEAGIDSKREGDIKAKFEKPEQETVVWSRWPQAFKFSAGNGLTDFIIVPIHLKSNSGGAIAAAEARNYEVELLLDSLNKASHQLEDEDLIILGDSNMLTATEPAAKKLINSGFKDCNGGDLGTHLSFNAAQRDAPFDRIFLSASQPETRNSCPTNINGAKPLDFKIVRPSDYKKDITKSEFRKLLSDHLMVRAGFCISQDDD